jgi:putative MATE family efflux protein
MKESNLTKGDITKHLKRIAVPASIGFLFNTLFNVVDTFYAGRLSTEALAGLTISFPIFFLIVSISSGIGNGTNALSSIALGEENNKKYHQIALNSFFVSIIIGLLIAFLSPLFVEPLLKLTGASGQSLQTGLDYIELIFFGSLLFVINFIINGLLYAQGNTKPFRNFLIIGFLANLLLDPLFIFGWLFFPKMGVQGIALATIIVQFIGTLYLSYKLLNSEEFKWQKLFQATINKETIFEIFHQGIPSALNNATIAIGVFIINYYALKYGGDSSVAAYGAGTRIEQLAFIPTLGLNVAALSIIGQNYGANKFERIHKVRKKATLYGVGIMLIGTVIIVPLAPYLIKLFNSDQAVIDAGTTFLHIEAIAFTSYIFLNISVSVLQGIKKPVFAILIGAYRQILPFGLFYLLGTILNMGIKGVWWGIVIINWSAVLIAVTYTNYQLKKVETKKSKTT